MGKVRNLSPENIARVRTLRRDMSREERIMWKALRHEKIGWKFRRQHPIGPYSLDFYCAELKLCVEVDGEQHGLRIEQDRKRDAYLADLGIRTIRIPAFLLKSHLDVAVDWVWRHCYLAANGCDPDS